MPPEEEEEGGFLFDDPLTFGGCHNILYSYILCTFVSISLCYPNSCLSLCLNLEDQEINKEIEKERMKESIMTDSLVTK